MAADKPLAVFLSYSHDSPEHADRVLALANRLRADGFDAALDQYEVSPPEGWPLWMERQIRDADFVLLVCTPTYLRRVMGEEEPGVGRGVRWEGSLIRQHLYADDAQNTRFVPVLLEGGAFADVPKPVQGATVCTLTAPDGYDSLRRRLIGQANAPRPPLGPRLRATDFFQPWNVLHARNPFFTGRGETLKDLRAALVGDGAAALTQPRALSGLGGVGKTQTAVEYAYRHRQDYQAVLWAQADSAPALLAAFAQIAATLALPEAGAQDLDQTRAAVTRWLAETPGYLLILDNADDPAALRPFLPPSPAGHVLLTSRVHNFARLHIGSPLDLPVLPPDEAVAFLLRRTERAGADATERAAAAELAEALGGLPLALEQAGAYISQKSRFADYLTSYRARALGLLETQGPQTGDYDKTVAATWSLNFEAVQAASAASAELLRVSAFLAPNAIPEELLILGAPALGETLAAALAGDDPLLLGELLEPLARYSLIRRDIEARTYDIHRLVQAVIRHGMDEATRRDYAELVVGAVAQASPDVEFSNWPFCERLLPHQWICIEQITRYGLASTEAAFLINQLGFYLNERAQYVEAEPLYQRALAITEQTLGPAHPNTALSLNNLASLYDDQGRYTDAEPLLKRALAIIEQFCGPAHPQMARSLNNLAALYHSQGQYALALPLYQRVLAITEQTLGLSHPQTARSLNNLAALYNDQGEYAQTQILYMHALAINEQFLGPAHPSTALSLNNLAYLYCVQGKDEKAEPLFQRALAVREKALGPEHPDTAISLNNLASLYYSQGRYAEAEPLLKRALAIFETALGAEHPTTKTIRGNYAGLLDQRKP